MNNYAPATTWRVKRIATYLQMVAFCAVLAQTAAIAQTASDIPRFRHVDPAAAAPSELPQGIVRLLTDKDFAPFSFEGSDGVQTGIAVELARAACAEMRLACEFVSLPFAELIPALERGEGDAIVSGTRINEQTLIKSETTRPYFVATGRFLVPQDSKLEGTSIRTLAGKRLGYVRGTAHGAFIEQNYARSALVPFDTAALMFAALRANELDAAFADGLFALYWIKGANANGCCKPLDGSYIDRNTFSRGLSILARKDRKNLRASLDYALDRLEEKGETARILSRYVPGAMW
jgi:polar amino acid transport system substrate-binding protein